MSVLLSAIVFLPLAGALVVALLPREEEDLARHTGLLFATGSFVASLAMIAAFSPTEAGFQLVVDHPWIDAIGVRYHLGVDGISLWLVVLCAFLVPLALLSSYRAVTRRVKEFIVAFLVLETGMLGAFLALDLFLFYVFWEVMLVPMYLIIGIWGGERRVYASIKFVLYTVVGSLLMLVAILYLYLEHGRLSGTYTFDLQAVSRLVLGPTPQLLCFGAFALAFAIKVPLVPLHTWLPDAHVEAPTAGSVILAGVLLKLGTYGLLRFGFPLFPYATATLGLPIAILCVVGVIYGSLVAWAQGDVKKLIAYSSVAHMGLCVLGLLAMNARGIEGALCVMLAHGVSTGGLFLSVGVLYERRHTRRIDEFGGVFAAMPVFGAIFLIVCLSSIALPGTNGFVGEFLVLFGTFDAWRAWSQANLPALFPHPKLFAALAATGAILGAVYMLWMFQKVMFGPITNPKNRELPDLSAREIAVFVPIVLAIFVMGLWPRPFTERMDGSVHRTISAWRESWAAGPKGLGERFENRLLGPAAEAPGRPGPGPSAPAGRTAPLAPGQAAAGAAPGHGAPGAQPAGGCGAGCDGAGCGGAAAGGSGGGGAGPALPSPGAERATPGGGGR